jgi:hypothetical protein
MRCATLGAHRRAIRPDDISEPDDDRDDDDLSGWDRAAGARTLTAGRIQEPAMHKSPVMSITRRLNVIGAEDSNLDPEPECSTG